MKPPGFAGGPQQFDSSVNQLLRHCALELVRVRRVVKYGISERGEDV